MKVYVVVKMWEGLIDDIEIYKDAKTATEMLENWIEKHKYESEGSGLWIVEMEET